MILMDGARWMWVRMQMMPGTHLVVTSTPALAQLAFDSVLAVIPPKLIEERQVRINQPELVAMYGNVKLKVVSLLGLDSTSTRFIKNYRPVSGWVIQRELEMKMSHTRWRWSDVMSLTGLSAVPPDAMLFTLLSPQSDELTELPGR